jgi:hypothetical protein
MYLISNTDRDYIIKYLGLMIANTTQSDLRAMNAVRLAKQLVNKLEAKQPLPAEATEAIKNLPR